MCWLGPELEIHARIPQSGGHVYNPGTLSVPKRSAANMHVVSYKFLAEVDVTPFVPRRYSLARWRAHGAEAFHGTSEHRAYTTLIDMQRGMRYHSPVSRASASETAGPRAHADAPI